MIELYHNAGSTCSQKVRLCLEEKGLAWTSRHVDLRAGDQHQDWYVQLNPRRVVPTLVHDGRVVPESNVILEFLDDVHPERLLRPQDPHSRARMRLWNKQLDEGIHEMAISVISFALVLREALVKDEDRRAKLLHSIPDPAKRQRRQDVIEHGVESKHMAAALALVKRLLGDMETALAHQSCLAGDEYSLADVAFTPSVGRLLDLGLSGIFDDKPNVVEWFMRCRARPSFSAAITDWHDAGVLEKMGRAGEEQWPRVRQIYDAV